MEVLTDVSLMPYGRHAGEQMIDVPKGHLLWLFGQLRKNKNNLTPKDTAIYGYIFDNYEAIKKEKDDYDAEEKPKKGLIVETKTGKIGRVYYGEARVNGKTCVRIGKTEKLLCDPMSLLIKGCFD